MVRYHKSRTRNIRDRRNEAPPFWNPSNWKHKSIHNQNIPWYLPLWTCTTSPTTIYAPTYHRGTSTPSHRHAIGSLSWALVWPWELLPGWNKNTLHERPLVKVLFMWFLLCEDNMHPCTTRNVLAIDTSFRNPNHPKWRNVRRWEIHFAKKTPFCPPFRFVAASGLKSLNHNDVMTGKSNHFRLASSLASLSLVSKSIIFA